MDWLRTGPMSFPVPILLIAFNRPAHTRRVLDSLRSIQPTQVFVAADGPRQGNENDVISCADVKRIIVDQIDWPCQVLTRFNSVNMGCRKGVEQAIDWFFDEVEEGIILEDDVVPTRDFFFYCQELLERHRFDQRIGSISGNCFLPKGVQIDESYYFSMYTHCWGWATWRRAWRCYDKDMLQWIDFRNCGWVEMLAGKEAANYWRRLIDQVYLNVVDTWDLVWLYSCWKSGFLTCVASVELIENIGFGLDATHTIDEVSPLDIPGILAFPLRHPSVWQSRRDFDVHTMKTHYHLSWVKKFSRKSRKLMRIIRGQLGHV
jgi:hypothetical protein